MQYKMLFPEIQKEVFNFFVIHLFSSRQHGLCYLFFSSYVAKHCWFRQDRRTRRKIHLYLTAVHIVFSFQRFMSGHQAS